VEVVVPGDDADAGRATARLDAVIPGRHQAALRTAATRDGRGWLPGMPGSDEPPLIGHGI
jgi:hypothetical protein